MVQTLYAATEVSRRAKGTQCEGVSRCHAEGLEQQTWVAVTQLRIEGMAGGSCAAAARVLTQSRIWRSPVWPARIPTILPCN